MISLVRNRIPDLPSDFWFLFASVLLDWMGKFIAIFLTLYLAEDQGLELAEITLIVTLHGAASVPAPMIGGILADRLGRHRTTYLGYWLTALSLLLLGFSPTVPAIIAAAILLGFIAGLNRPALSALIADVVPPEQRKTAYNLNYWAINIGALIALPLAGFLASVNYILLFLGDALTAFLAGLLIWRFVNPDHRTAASPVRQSHRNIFGIFSDRLMVGIAVLTFLFSTVFFQTQLALPLDMNATGISEVEFGAIMGINPLIIVLFQLPLTGLMRRWFSPVVLAGGAWMLGLGFGLTALASESSGYAGTIAIWTIGEMMFFPTAMSLVSEISPDEKRATYQGLFLTVWRPTSFIGVGLGGIVLEQFGASTLWGICFVIGVIMTIGFLVIGKAIQNRIAPAAIAPQAA
ncbi:MAG: MFS transporter [Chloroflexi bacterium]|nr:MFS transporter [Chloroflexota bacterium]